MIPAEAIKSILKERSETAHSFAQRLSITPQGLDNRLKGGMTVATLCEMSNMLDYKVVIVKKDISVTGYELSE